jgi:type VI secretion system secreted protein Hcp
MALDMFIDMGAIKGESRDKEMKDKIDILAWSWGMSQSGTTHTGGGGGAGKANFQDLSFTKYIDSSTNAMMNALAKGSHLETVTLTVRKAGDGQKKYILLTLHEVLVTSISTGGSGGEDRLTENVTLNFGKFSFAYTPQDSKGTIAGDKTFSWDIAENHGEVK